MERKWWKEAIGYEIYPRSFKDANGDGIGDLRGILEKLPYLHELGVNLLWICPFYPSPMHDNGYDVEDYYGIDPRFGTMEDMEALLERAGALGIRIIIDMVLNHTSSRHPWFQEALRNPDSEYREFYIFREGQERPSNVRSCFGGSVWEQVEEGVWYYHTFDRTQPDLNWENPALRKEIYKILNFWLNKGVSGFRMDAITYIKKGASLYWAETKDADGMRDVGEVGLNQPGIGAFLDEMRKECFAGREVMTVAEAPGVPYGELGKYIGENGHFSMIFDFSYADIDLAPGGSWCNQAEWDVPKLRQLIFKSQTSVQEKGWGAVYMENHDQPRSINKYFREKTAEPTDAGTRFLQSSALGTLLFGLRGTVFLYQGEELGMLNCPFASVEEFNDLNTVDQYGRAVQGGYSEAEAMKIVCGRSRDNSRTPFPWNDDDHAGFTEGAPWLKVNPDYPVCNAKREMGTERSVFRYYQRLIALRKSPDALETLVYGEVHELAVAADGVIAFSRGEKGGKEVTILVNMTDETVLVEMEKRRTLLGNYRGQEWKEDGIVLRGYEAVILE